jgi:hypothetical protein
MDVLDLILLFWPVPYLVTSWATTGQTLGMRALGLRVVRSDGMPLGWVRASIRVVTLGVAVVATGGLALGTVFFDARKRGPQDFVAGSVVLEAVPSRSAPCPNCTAETPSSAKRSLDSSGKPTKSLGYTIFVAGVLLVAAAGCVAALIGMAIEGPTGSYVYQCAQGPCSTPGISATEAHWQQEMATLLIGAVLSGGLGSYMAWKYHGRQESFEYRCDHCMTQWSQAAS